MHSKNYLNAYYVPGSMQDFSSKFFVIVQRIRVKSRVDRDKSRQLVLQISTGFPKSNSNLTQFKLFMKNTKPKDRHSKYSLVLH